MDPRTESQESARTVLSRTVRTPHQTNLILTVSEGAGFLLFLVFSGLAGCAIKKGLLIAGFSCFLSHFSIIDPFVNSVPEVMNPGSKGSRKVSIRGSKGAEYGPVQALRSLQALGTRYLVLSNTYPGWPRRGPGYRVTLTEDTGTEYGKCTSG